MKIIQAKLKHSLLEERAAELRRKLGNIRSTTESAEESGTTSEESRTDVRLQSSFYQIATTSSSSVGQKPVKPNVTRSMIEGLDSPSDSGSVEASKKIGLQENSNEPAKASNGVREKVIAVSNVTIAMNQVKRRQKAAVEAKIYNQIDVLVRKKQEIDDLKALTIHENNRIKMEIENERLRAALIQAQMETELLMIENLRLQKEKEENGIGKFNREAVYQIDLATKLNEKIAKEELEKTNYQNLQLIEIKRLAELKESKEQQIISPIEENDLNQGENIRNKGNLEEKELQDYSEIQQAPMSVVPDLDRADLIIQISQIVSEYDVKPVELQLFQFEDAAISESGALAIGCSNGMTLNAGFWASIRSDRLLADIKRLNSKEPIGREEALSMIKMKNCPDASSIPLSKTDSGRVIQINGNADPKLAYFPAIKLASTHLSEHLTPPTIKNVLEWNEKTDELILKSTATIQQQLEAMEKVLQWTSDINFFSQADIGANPESKATIIIQRPVIIVEGSFGVHLSEPLSRYYYETYKQVLAVVATRVQKPSKILLSLSQDVKMSIEAVVQAVSELGASLKGAEIILLNNQS